MTGSRAHARVHSLDMTPLLALSNLTAARWQMTVSLVFHMVFAAVGIGLPLLMVIAERRHLRTARPEYRDLARRWAKATGLLFAVGAVSGTALSFELGLLWPKYTAIMGSAVGHMFALEGYAFFIEAIFIGLYLYGWDRLSPRAHWWCGVVVAASGAASGVLVLGVNAWIQVPIGFTMNDAGVVTSTQPLAIFGTYAWWTMAVHSTLSCYIAVAFAVAAIHAAAYLKGRRDDYHRAAMRIALAVGAITAILQPLSGDLLAKFVYKTQPAKFAAMEAHFETSSHAPIQIGGLTDAQAGKLQYAISIPGALSFLATHDFSATVKGLNDIPRDLWPNVGLTHLAFDVMVGIGTLLAAISVWYAWRRWRRNAHLFDSRPLLRALVITGPLGFIALEAGWIVTEAGRQPWVIQGHLKTADAVTPYRDVTPFLWGFIALYVLLGTMVVVLLRYMRRST
jgi:cytochrome bd ubiquinol oxidase subunit I